jgi:hypothetical protein
MEKFSQLISEEKKVEGLIFFSVIMVQKTE